MAVGIWKQGYQYTESGWPMVDAKELDYGAIPGSNFKLGVRIGEPNAILKAVMVRLHREVEPMDPTQCGCFTVTNSMPNSNHNGGVAIDWNWRRHPWKVPGTFGLKKPLVEKIVADCRGTVEWGGYWSRAYMDEMHFEMRYGPGHPATIQLAKELWDDGLWNVWKKGAPPTTTPSIPPTNDTFLLESGSTGPLVLKLQQELNRVFRSYSKLVVDGIYGYRTTAVVAEFQKRAGGLEIDGKVGPLTRAALNKYGVKI